MFADLHLHTNFSDGTYTPEELVSQAAKNHLAAIALTDHDTVEGCERAANACRALEIEFIPSALRLTGNKAKTRFTFSVTFSIRITRNCFPKSENFRPCGRIAFVKWWPN